MVSAHRITGDYYESLSPDAAKTAIDADFPKPQKRFGIKPDDVGHSLLAQVAEAVMKNSAPH